MGSSGFAALGLSIITACDVGVKMQVREIVTTVEVVFGGCSEAPYGDPTIAMAVSALQPNLYSTEMLLRMHTSSVRARNSDKYVLNSRS